MAKLALTDLQVLKAILQAPAGVVPERTARAFQAMYDGVAAGIVIGLTKKQRAWVESIYEQHDIGNPNRQIRKRPVSILDQGLLVVNQKRVSTTPLDQEALKANQKKVREYIEKKNRGL